MPARKILPLCVNFLEKFSICIDGTNTEVLSKGGSDNSDILEKNGA